jgi:lactoylglutathione lyase
MITGVNKVVVAVGDQGRAKEFWTSRVGFELHRDEAYGEERWIEVPELTGRGVAFATPPHQQHSGWWSLFEDPDGSRYALGQWD